MKHLRIGLVFVQTAINQIINVKMLIILKVKKYNEIQISSWTQLISIFRYARECPGIGLHLGLKCLAEVLYILGTYRCLITLSMSMCKPSRNTASLTRWGLQQFGAVSLTRWLC